jgi:hypothetical protein
MKVNGTRVEDLAGTGLITNQRYVMPLWVTVPLAVTKHGARFLWWVSALLVRGWAVSVPAAVLLVVYAAAGWWGVVTR